MRGCGAPGRIRTSDARLRTAALYPLSYGGSSGMVPRPAIGGSKSGLDERLVREAVAVADQAADGMERLVREDDRPALIRGAAE
jgi:hypothetical protein